MTQPTQERSAAFTGRQEPGRDPSAQMLLARIERWQRIALGCAVVGAGAIVICAFAMSRPLPQVGPPPSGIAPLLPTSAPASPGFNGASTPGNAGSSAPVAPVGTSAVPAAPQANGQAYLAFVRQIDQQRSAMVSSLDAAIAQQNGAPQEFAAPNSSGGSVGAALAQTAAGLPTAFQAQAAPPECAALSSTYSKLLQDQCGMAAQAASSISGGDLRSAAALVAGDQKQNQADALAANQALGAAAAALQSDQPFIITADSGQSAGVGTPAQAGQPGSLPSGVLLPSQPAGTPGLPGRPSQDVPAGSNPSPSVTSPAGGGDDASAPNPTPAP